jgi:hypothetical protein
MGFASLNPSYALLVPGLVGPPQCYWTYGQPVWNGYAWVRPRVQVCQ